MHSRILRTKPVESMLEGTGTTTAHGTKLAQVLTTVDLISLGVGSCVGTGMYVVSGLVAKEMAGPGVIVSFIIAAVASILSGKCLKEEKSCRKCSFYFGYYSFHFSGVVMS
jgi:cationic amino acid transporter 14